MADLQIPRCAAPGCTNDVPPRKSRGPAAKYCSDACKQRAFRARRSAAAWLPAVPADQLHIPQANSTDEQVARAVLEARSLSGAFARLAGEARPTLAWRCEGMAETIRDGLDEHFEGVDR